MPVGSRALLSFRRVSHAKLWGQASYAGATWGQPRRRVLVGEGQMQPLWPAGKRRFPIIRSKVLTEGKHLNFQINGFPHTLHNRIAGQVYPSHSVLESPSYTTDLGSYKLASAVNSDISTLISTWCGRYITRDVLVAWNFPTQL